MILDQSIQVIELIPVILLWMQDAIDYAPIFFQKITLMHKVAHKGKPGHKSIHSWVFKLSNSK